MTGRTASPLELLDTKHWETRQELATAMFYWIEGWYNPRRRHSGLDCRLPADYEKIKQSATEIVA
jgi:transposase InsO family protein